MQPLKLFFKSLRVVICVFLIMIYGTANVHGQDKIRSVLWFGPADNVAVYGINLSPIVFKLPSNSVVHGINIEGIGIPFFLYMMPIDPIDAIDADSIKIENEFNVNGINLAPAGILQKGRTNGLAVTGLYSFIEEVNGVNLSLLYSINYKLNGLSLSLSNSTVELNGLQMGLFNRAKKARGVQIGLLNRGGKFKGLQIGLWNVNDKRKLPILNW